MTTLAADSFNRANAGSLGANWTDIDVGWNVASNQAVGVGAAIASTINNTVTWPNNQWAQCTVVTRDSTSDNGPGPLIRGVGAGPNSYFAQCSAVETRLYKRVTGFFTQVGADGVAVSSGDVVYIEAQGSSLLIKRNGAIIVGSVTDSSLSSGSAGLWDATVGATGVVDDWSGGDFSVSTVGWPPRQTFHPGRSPGLSPASGRFFQPLRATTPAVVSGDVAIALTGLTATFSQGSVAPTVSYVPAGQTATFTEGVVAPTVSYGLAGRTATFAEGVAAPSVSYGLTGQTATFTEGIVAPNVGYGLTGQTANFAEGVIAPGVSYGLTGQTATFTEGVLTPTTGGDVTLSLSGQTATFTEGAIALNASYGLSGQAASFVEGGVAPSVDYGLIGQTATFAEGSIAPATSGDVTLSLSGLTAAFTLGTLVAAGGDVVTPVQAGGAVGGGGASHRGSNTKEILRLRKKDEDFTEELRSMYRAIIRRGEPQLVEKAQEIVRAATPRIGAPRVSIAELPPEQQDEQIQQLKELKADLEIALRMAHAEMELEEENTRVINIIMQVI